MKHLGGGRAPRSQRRAVRWAWLASGTAVVVAAAADRQPHPEPDAVEHRDECGRERRAEAEQRVEH
jgi:hypothetical protein